MGDLLTTVVAYLQQYGYLATREAGYTWDDIELSAAVAKYQRMDANVDGLREQIVGTEEAGTMGPATAMAMAMPRCNCPDVEPGSGEALAAIGTAGWRNCHGADGMHKAIVRVNQKNEPGFLKPHIKEVLQGVQDAYAKVGLLFVFMSMDKIDLLTGKRVTANTANIEYTYTRGKGWIGLAIVGHSGNQHCTSNIWAQFDYNYQPRNVVREWQTLIMHELGHNCGLQHTRGGIMNPSVINGLGASWEPDDPATKTLRKWFGGTDVTPNPQPPSPPLPPTEGEWPAPGQPIGTPMTLSNGMRAQLYRIFGG